MSISPRSFWLDPKRTKKVKAVPPPADAALQEADEFELVRRSTAFFWLNRSAAGLRQEFACFASLRYASETPDALRPFGLISIRCCWALAALIATPLSPPRLRRGRVLLFYAVLLTTAGRFRRRAGYYPCDVRHAYRGMDCFAAYAPRNDKGIAPAAASSIKKGKPVPALDREGITGWGDRA